MATRDNGATKFETVRYEPKGAICHIVLNRPEKLNAATDQLVRSEEHTSELQSQSNLVCRLLLETITDFIDYRTILAPPHPFSVLLVPGRFLGPQLPLLVNVNAIAGGAPAVLTTCCARLHLNSTP